MYVREEQEISLVLLGTMLVLQLEQHLQKQKLDRKFGFLQVRIPKTLI